MPERVRQCLGRNVQALFFNKYSTIKNEQEDIMKKILSILAAAVMTASALTGAMTASASEVATGKCGENVTWTLDSEGVLTISGEGQMYGTGDSDRYIYTYRNWKYYYYASQIKEVVIEEGVTFIGPSAFGNVGNSSNKVAYPNLKKITLPSTIEVIGQAAFYATVIENLTVPENVKKIYPYAYSYSPIENAIINDGVYLCASSFSDCDNLKEVTVGANVYYGHGAGWGSENHSETVFMDCTAFEKITILGSGTVGQRFTTIEKGLPNTMCYGCKSLKEVSILCSDLEYIGEANTTSVNNETFPTTGTDITYYVYKDSKTEATLKKAGYLKDAERDKAANYVHIASPEELKELEEAIKEAEAVEADKYTDETVSVLNEAVESAKPLLENEKSTMEDVSSAAEAIKNAITALKEKPAPTKPITDTSKKPSGNQTKPTAAKPSISTKVTRNAKVVAKDKKAAQKVMKQAKLNSLKVKSGAKKKISASWKKVKKAKGYEVQVSAKKNFKKVIFKKDLNKTKLTIKNKNIKSKKTYYVRVRAYAAYKDANNKTVKVYSKWNKQLRKVKVK